MRVFSVHKSPVSSWLCVSARAAASTVAKGVCVGGRGGQLLHVKKKKSHFHHPDASEEGLGSL